MIQIKSEEHLNKLASRNNGHVLVLFTSPTWCMPCRRFEPHWVKAEKSELLDDYIFAVVNMGETPEDTSAHWATEKFNILGVPAVKNFTIDGPVDVESRTVVGLIRELTA